jgi:hypothetical protein
VVEEYNPEIWKVASNIVSSSHGQLRRDEPLSMLGMELKEP